MKKSNIFFKTIITLITLLSIVIVFHLYKYYKIKYISGTIISKNSSYFEIITSNDSIYKFDYNLTNYEIGNNIKIKYSKTISDFDKIQNVNIKSISKTNIKLNYSKKAKKIVNNMSLKEKVGQLLLVRVPIKNKIDTIKEYNIGGYILFQRDIDNKSKQDLIDDINSFQKASSIPLLIAIDEEGGEVSRLSSNKKIVDNRFLSPKELYDKGGFKEIKKDAINKTILLKELGINMNLSPVADITKNKESYMYNRSFGKDKKETSKYIKTIMSTQTKEVSYVLKHFPGYADNFDTHTGISIDNRSFKTISKNDFIPFKVGIENDANAIMVSHNIVNSIDNKSGSISRNMHNILRNDLKFKGIILTDDLSMNALKQYDEKDIYTDAVLAGNNILIVTDYITAYNDIYTSVIEGKISEELIDRLVLKNIEFKLNNIYK